MRSLLIFSFFIVLNSCNNVGSKQTEAAATEKPYPKADFDKTRKIAREALEFCRKKKYNTDFCLLIDMSLHSGVKRFFVWDYIKDTISHSCLAGHGCGDNSWSDDESKDCPQFSNTDGSHCSALGKYKIGERAHSDWGINIKYVLHGLEKSNNNAFGRFIVFHSWEEVADEDVYPNGTPEGWGCPTISNNNMKIIDPMLKAVKRPVLMWIYK